ncbi:hypothetical protein AAVH_10337 [Aphelenchoides avenae]|nr:hypothetical protein AAVH_10337 [Aphelenchus avenae]
MYVEDYPCHLCSGTSSGTVLVPGDERPYPFDNWWRHESVRHGREPYKHTPTYDVFEPRQVKYDEIFHVPHDSRSQQALSIEFWYEGSVMKMFGEETS